MALLHNLGFPRIGKKRELKFALENYWAGKIDQATLQQQGREIREQNWALQADAGVNLLPVGDFAWYDHVLATTLLLNAVPARYRDDNNQADLDTLFGIARGKTASGCACAASDMTKWFNTNYHYIVPELQQDQSFSLGFCELFSHVDEAKQHGHQVKPVLLGPVSYLYLAKCAGEEFDKLSLLAGILPVYQQVLARLAAQGVSWVQIDEPILSLELPADYQQALKTSFNALAGQGVKLLLATYFDEVSAYLDDISAYPIDGAHFDLVAAAQDVSALDSALKNKVLSLGVINGRNIWRADLSAIYQQINQLAQQRGDTLWLAPSCSLLHTPVDLSQEQKLDPQIRSWLAFASQKGEELKLLNTALTTGDCAAIDQYSAPVKERLTSSRVNNPAVQQRVAALTASDGQRHSAYPVRAQHQQQALQLPLLPTTTIGSFAQTADIRQARRDVKAGHISPQQYQEKMQQQIKYAVEQQEKLGLDVLVHGEAERNDMVEYFGELLEGFAFTQFGWVQSYGSRCVKPPVIWGDVSRSQAMTVQWSAYAQSLTNKAMKGMLTGPVTILFWSFIRDDLDNQTIAKQIALALRDEVNDLEKAGINIIQIDEPAFREGMPLKTSQWQSYLEWAAYAFRVSASGVKDKTQIHTHMCYSEFNHIIKAIADMDADVITIETSRSNMDLLNAFEDFAYPNAIGPGVYDIHTPNIPQIQWIKALIQNAAQKIPLERLWVNPDCGLKTRTWEQTYPALENMVAATHALREELTN